MGLVRDGWLVVVAGMLSACGGGPAAAPATAPASSTATAPATASPAASAIPVSSAAPAPSAAPALAASPAPDTPSFPPSSFVEDTPAPPPTPAPTIALAAPRKDDVLDPARAPDQEVRFKLTGWKLEGGRSVELVLDDRASLVVNEASRPVHLKDIDGSPAAVAPGQHLLVALLRGPSGQWVKPVGKGRSPVAVVPFFVGQKSTPAWKEGDPLLVYAGPPPGPAPADGLLVDYYLVNAELGHEKYSIHASVTGPGLMTGKVIDVWRPWRIRGARQGSYTVRLELDRYEHDLGESGSSTTVVLASKPLAGRWTSVTRDFDVPPAR